MKTRTRTTSQESTTFDEFTEENLELETLTDDELESLLFEEEEKPKGIWNLPTLAGLSLIMVGIAYMFQEMGLWSGFDLSTMATMLPWLAGILIILLGFGVLSWRPKKKRKVRKTVEVKSKKSPKVRAAASGRKRKRLIRSKEKKISGVCGGVAEYFNIDPTLVRIAFVIGTIASGGPFLLAYLVLSFVMPKPDAMTMEERITIIRDS